MLFLSFFSNELFLSKCTRYLIPQARLALSTDFHEKSIPKSDLLFPVRSTKVEMQRFCAFKSSLRYKSFISESRCTVAVMQRANPSGNQQAGFYRVISQIKKNQREKKPTISKYVITLLALFALLPCRVNWFMKLYVKHVKSSGNLQHRSLE